MKVPVKVTLPEGHIRDLKKLAEARGKSMGSVIRAATRRRVQRPWFNKPQPKLSQVY